MIGQRSSLFFTILTNPLVWTGFILAILHLHTLKDNTVWQIFSSPETYRNLFIGAAIYTLIFDRHYTQDRKKLDIMRTFLSVILNAYIILFTWGMTVFAVTEYQETGKFYGQTIRTRMKKEKNITPEPAPIPQNLNFESGKKYKVTPSDDGSFIIEVINQ